MRTEGRSELRKTYKSIKSAKKAVESRREELWAKGFRFWEFIENTKSKTITVIWRPIDYKEGGETS